MVWMFACPSQSAMLAVSIPAWRIEIFVFLDLLTQVALVWGVFNLVPFPGFDGGHSLDAALEIFAPARAQRLGAVIKGAAAVLGVAVVWYYFGAFSAAILVVSSQSVTSQPEWASRCGAPEAW